jgi:hypothetical protein
MVELIFKVLSHIEIIKIPGLAHSAPIFVLRRNE